MLCVVLALLTFLKKIKMKGFFDIKPKQKPTAPRRVLPSKTLSCAECGLIKGCIHPKMEVTGEGRKKVLFIGEAPGEKEDQKGVQFIGPAGKELRYYLEENGFDLDRDGYKINAVNCRPPENRTPTTLEINACRKRWKNAIKTLEIEKVILLGGVACESFFGQRIEDSGTIGKWIKWKIPDQDYGVWVYPNYHPSYLLHNKDEVIKDIFKTNLQKALNHSVPFPKHEENIHCIYDVEKAIPLLERISRKRPRLLAFDYEATGIKPHCKGHKILSLSLCFSEDKAYAMPLFENGFFLDLWQDILEDPQIKKTAHNMKFESTWTRELLGYDIRGWAIDTMISSHVLDNRSGITSLKFQSYVNFGIVGYEKEMDFFKKGTKPGEDPKSANKFNRMDEAPLDKLLLYNGRDSLYEFKLAKKHLPLIKNNEGYKLFHNGILSFDRMEDIGWLIDEGYYEKVKNKMNSSQEQLENSISTSKEAMLWKKKKRTPLNFNSTPQLRELFFEILDFKSTKKTNKGKGDNAAMDKEVLTQLSTKSKIAKSLIELKKNKVLVDKIKAYQRESVNGIIHPSYNLHIPATFRSSCNNPNQQNNPKRDEESRKIIRSGIIPRKGHLLVARDFKGVEVSTGCFYHKDPVMIDYCSDSSKDMHRDQASKLFFLSNEEVMENKKTVRHFAKNMFVFPQFYGDYYESCAKSMWEAADETVLKSGIPLIQHLEDNGIRDYFDFEDHVKAEENYFWNKKFKKYTQWKEDTLDEYYCNGYTDLLTGFRCWGPMKKNEVINYRVQGTAFHLLLWSIIEIEKEFILGKWNTKIIGQIHDDVLFDVNPEEFEDLIKLTDEIETKKIRKHWDWINVPLGVETEISNVNGNWYKMEEYKEKSKNYL